MEKIHTFYYFFFEGFPSEDIDTNSDEVKEEDDQELIIIPFKET